MDQPASLDVTGALVTSQRNSVYFVPERPYDITRWTPPARKTSWPHNSRPRREPPGRSTTAGGARPPSCHAATDWRDIYISQRPTAERALGPTHRAGNFELSHPNWSPDRLEASGAESLNA